MGQVSTSGLDPDARTLALWRRNLAALVAAVFIGFTGFTLVMPFLPIYIQQMGETDLGAIAMWTGVSLGVTPAMTALVPGSVAASTESPAPSETPIRSGFCVLPFAANAASAA